MRSIRKLPYTIILFVTLSISHLTASAYQTLDKTRLVPRARVLGCTPEQSDILKTILRAIPQLSLFAIRLDDTRNVQAPPVGTLGGGARYDEGSLRTFNHHARHAFTELFGDSERARQTVTRRFRFLKYEAERSEGGVFGGTHEGRVLLICDFALRWVECRENLPYPFGTYAMALAQLNIVVVCPSFFDQLRPYPPVAGQPSQIDELALQMLVTDTVRRDVTPLFLGAEPAGPENSSYRMQDYIQRLFILTRRYLIPPGSLPYQVTPE